MTPANSQRAEPPTPEDSATSIGARQNVAQGCSGAELCATVDHHLPVLADLTCRIVNAERGNVDPAEVAALRQVMPGRRHGITCAS